MPDKTEALKALELIKKSGFPKDAEWTIAHEIVQDREGVPIFDAIHALLHRLEGDYNNAAYWDRRAGTNFGRHGPETEIEQLEKMVRSA